MPKPELKWECHDCDLFDDCVGKGIDNPVFDLPLLREKKYTQLRDSGIINIEDIPDNFKLTDNQSKVRNSVMSGEPIIIKDVLKNELEKIEFPAYYLDYETMMMAIPRYPDITPFTQIPTQYSLHKCSSPGKFIHHYEYLADPKRDCRRDLAEGLIRDCEESGSIIVYSSFEKTQINGLIKEFDDLADDLNSIIDRLVDLCSIIKKCYYNPNFHGSYSIKVILPVLVPDMTYENLDISDGDEAMAEYSFMVLGKYDDEEVEVKRRALLDYCKQDTLAMVRVHEKLVKLL